MKRSHNRGFTVVELALIIVIIGILAAITIAAYGRVQAEARDTKRKTDVEIFVSEMEKYYDKNGEYPSGCSDYGYAARANCTDIPQAISSEYIYTDSTVANTKQILPNIPDSFGDPKGNNNLPFKYYGASSLYYAFKGQYDLTDSYGGSSYSTYVWNIDCSPGVSNSNMRQLVAKTPQSARSTAFMIAYFSEVDGKWYVYQGKRGADIINNSTGARLRGTTFGKCVFMP